MTNYIQVKSSTGELFALPITGRDKPEVPQELLHEWQHIVALLSDVTLAPVALIMRLSPTDIEVCATSVPHSPAYKVGSREQLGLGLYCEEVLCRGRLVTIKDARDTPLWAESSDAQRGLTSYIGLPIRWPDGELYGTICMLGQSGTFPLLQGSTRLLQGCRRIAEADLQNILAPDAPLKYPPGQAIPLADAHHNIKSYFEMIADIIQAKQLQGYGPNCATGPLLPGLLYHTQRVADLYAYLTQPQNNTISIGPLVRTVASRIISSTIADKIEFSVRGGHISVCPKTTFFISLLICELMANALGPMPDSNCAPRILITLQDLDDQMFQLRFTSNTESMVHQAFNCAHEPFGKAITTEIPTRVGGTLELMNTAGTDLLFSLPKNCGKCIRCLRMKKAQKTA